MSLAQVSQGKGQKQGIQRRSVPPEKEQGHPEGEGCLGPDLGSDFSLHDLGHLRGFLVGSF